MMSTGRRLLPARWWDVMCDTQSISFCLSLVLPNLCTATHSQSSLRPHSCDPRGIHGGIQ